MDIITVFLDENRRSFLEVPITPQTLASDVISCIRGASSNELTLKCVNHKNQELALNENDKIFEVTRKFGTELDFILTYKRESSAQKAGYPVNKVSDDSSNLSNIPPQIASRQATRYPNIEPSSRGTTTSTGQQSQQRALPPAAPQSYKQQQPQQPISKQSQQVMAPERRSQQPTQEFTWAQIQEMRERSKVLREQVVNTQRSVQHKEGQLQRLRNERLPSEEIKQESDKLLRLQERINAQEARLKKLKDTKNKIQQQVIVNNSMNAELDGLKSILKNKEKEMEELGQFINQLTTKIQQANSMKNANSNKKAQQVARIERLKQEMLVNKRATESVQEKFSLQREALQNKKDEMSKVDLQISELWRKLQQAKAQQQTQQKTATVVAAVGPFEHKPSTKALENDAAARLSPTSKPQEIDIKLLERNSGSGQSSPSISDEREVMPVKSQNKTDSPTLIEKPSSQKGALAMALNSREKQMNSTKQLTNGLANQSKTLSNSQSIRQSQSRNDTAKEPVVSAAPPGALNLSVSTPTISSILAASPSTQPLSPIKSPQPIEMKIERGPVHTFKLFNPPASQNQSDASSSAKLKSFNAKPRPFGAAPLKPVTSSLSDGSREVKQAPPSPANVASPQDLRTAPFDQPDRVPNALGEITYQSQDGAMKSSVPQIDLLQLNAVRSRPASLSESVFAGSSGVSSAGISSINPQPVGSLPEQEKKFDTSQEQTLQNTKNSWIRESADIGKLQENLNERDGLSFNKDYVALVKDIVSNQTEPVAVKVESEGIENKQGYLQVLSAVDIPSSSISPDMVTSGEDHANRGVPVIYEVDSNSNHTKTKSIIRKSGKKNIDNARFHPLIILLDTALNGTVEEVREILPHVPDPSSSNDEGITALHNAICAGHMDIVRTLVEFGVDVNAVDTDGWTPLHCAASCNNQPVVEYLLRNGACVFATTYSDQETALEKCEIDEEGYEGTSKFLQMMEARLGVSEPAYSVYKYDPQNPDELALKSGDSLSIIRQGDDVETDWWWAKCGDKEGFVAKNLLAFTPRVTPKYKVPEE